MKARVKRRTLRELMPHQEEGVERALGEDHTALIMQMRLGKTLTSVRVVKERDAYNALVVCPVSAIEAWENELSLEGERFISLHGLGHEERERAMIDAIQARTYRPWVIANFEMILGMAPRVMPLSKKREVPLVAQLPWDHVIVDESTRIKNPQAQTTQIFHQGFDLARHRMILTGLPAPESELDLFEQFYFLDREWMGYTDFWRYRKALFEPGHFSKHHWFRKEGTRKRIKSALHARAFVKTRKDAGMPENWVNETRFVDMNDPQRKLYDQIEEEFAVDFGDERWETAWATTKHIWLCMIAGGFSPRRRLLNPAKADEIVYLLKTELARDKAVVWHAFRHECEYMIERCKKANIRVVSIMGGDPPDKRRRALQNLRDKDGARVLCAMEQCGKFSMDCSVCDTAIWYSNDPSCEARAQSRERTFHPKKQDTILNLDVATRDTVDMDNLRAVREKVTSAKMMMRMFHQEFLSRRS